MKHNLFQKIFNKRYRQKPIKLKRDELEIIQILRKLTSNEVRQSIINFIKSLDNS